MAHQGTHRRKRSSAVDGAAVAWQRNDSNALRGQSTDSLDFALRGYGIPCRWTPSIARAWLGYAWHGKAAAVRYGVVLRDGMA